MVVKRNRILIVEDEESLLKLESILLSSKGYKVVGVADGVAAIEEIFSNIPDLVILDVMLPGIDGFEVCRRIKEDPATSKIPVIMLTARKNTQDMDRGLQSGADAYITKPFKSAQLIGTIERILSNAVG
ncbi:response regulator transcription factor [Citrifermentans pelophilum]|jgi:twitching motility two-component system response regulator PilG|uniref:response regulator transcription factor n=1 Tax=Geoanaerobacter pelophilus TaxID=60036 RepID=UPI001FE55468|nr:response regulator [Geoanaerobacter pelophilus]